MMKFAAALTLALALLAPTASAEDSRPLPDVLKTATANKQLVVVEFGATWCGPCQDFLATVLPHPLIQTALTPAQFASYSVDIDDTAKEQAKLYGVFGYPTFLVLDNAGNVLARKVGGTTAEEFQAWLKAAGVPQPTDAELQSRAKATPPNPVALLELAARARAAGQLAKAREYYTAAKRADAKNTAKVGELATWQLAALDHNAANEAKLIGLAQAHLKAYPKGVVAAQLQDALLTAPTTPASQRAAIAEQLLAANAKSTGKLNSLAYTFMAAKLPKQALAAAELALKAKRDASVLDTVAEAHHANGNRAQALAFADQAIAGEKDPQNKADLEANRKRFAEGNAESPDVIRERAQTQDALSHTLTELVAVPKVQAPEAISQRQLEMETSVIKGSFMACRKHAGSLDEAIIRLDGTSFNAPTKVAVMLATEQVELRKCLTEAARATRMPRLPEGSTHLTIVMPLTGKL